MLKLLEDDSENEFVLFALAQEYSKVGNLTDSLKYYQALKQKNENYVGLYYHLAALYAELDEYDKALSTYETGIAIAKKLQDHHALSELMNAKTNLEMEL